MPTIASYTNNKTVRPDAGFGLIEVLLIVVVAGVLGATGWYAFRSKARTDKILNGAAAESQKTAANQNGLVYSAAVPADFKSQLQTFYDAFKPTCALVAPGPVIFQVTKNIDNQQIQVRQTCGGVGGTHIYVLSGGKLTDAAVSAGTYACTDVDQYKISSRLASNCYVSNWDGSQTIRANTNP